MLEDIEIFSAIAKHHSFAKAARSLSLSTSIVTRRLSRLEKELGARLVQRTTRQVSLTEAGLHYYHDIQEILNALQAAKQNIKSLTQEITGTLRVGLPISISHLVTRSLPQFLTAYPQLKIQIIHGNHLLDLLENRFDVIVHCGALPNSNFHYKNLGSWQKVICASPKYLAKHKVPKKPQDLLQHNCLDHADNFDHCWQFHVNGKPEFINVDGNVRINSSIALCQLAVENLGIVYLPSFTVFQALQEEKLISILQQYQPPDLHIAAIYPSKHYLSEKTKIFIDFLAELLASMGKEI
jgi:DNA-binding transcriptional LysR family regulator